MVEKNVAIPDKDKLWDYIVTEGRKVEGKYIVNKFNADDIQTILGTMDFFGASDVWLAQTDWDLRKPKYRLSGKREKVCLVKEYLK